MSISISFPLIEEPPVAAVEVVPPRGPIPHGVTEDGRVRHYFTKRRGGWVCDFCEPM